MAYGFNLPELSIDLGEDAIVRVVARALFRLQADVHDDQFEVREPGTAEIGDVLAVNDRTDEHLDAVLRFRVRRSRRETEPLVGD